MISILLLGLLIGLDLKNIDEFYASTRHNMVRQNASLRRFAPFMMRRFASTDVVT